MQIIETRDGYTLTREERQKFLAGTDDGQPFRVRVSARCTTIEAAVEWLRPAGVPEGSIRQGEFYFVPLSIGEHDVSAKMLNQVDSYSWKYPSLLSETDAGSSKALRMVEAQFSASHDAAQSIRVQVSGVTAFIGRRNVKTHSWTGRIRFYVCGKVTHEHHPEIVLADWHEVVPNKASTFGCGEIGRASCRERV